MRLNQSNTTEGVPPWGLTVVAHTLCPCQEHGDAARRNATPDNGPVQGILQQSHARLQYTLGTCGSCKSNSGVADGWRLRSGAPNVSGEQVSMLQAQMQGAYPRHASPLFTNDGSTSEVSCAHVLWPNRAVIAKTLLLACNLARCSRVRTGFRFGLDGPSVWAK
jgi:hypothetical protein